MQTGTVHERLRQARLSKGENLAAIAERTGVRESLLIAIESGRYDTLPRGIYGRAAIRAYAEALGFDGQAMVSQCEELLTPLEDPISGLARVHGFEASRLKAEAAKLTGRAASLIERSWLTPAGRPARPLPNWRCVAAAAIDSAIVLAMLLVLVVVTITIFGMPVMTGAAGPAFGVVAMLLAMSYFAVFGGIGGETAGSRLAGLKAPPAPGTRVDLRGVAVRAFNCAVRDALVIEQLAAWIRGVSADYRSSANRRDRQRAEQPAGS